jgi:ABC-type transporter Mla MlaB component
MRSTAQAKLDNSAIFATTIINEELAESYDMPTVMGASTQQFDMPTVAAAIDDAATKAAPVSGFDSKSFESSKLFAVEMGDALLDPELEEAAIRFANNDDAGAEAVLLSAYQIDGNTETAAQTWIAALFDLYRCTGQRSRFEEQSLDYAQRFGRSAPAWSPDNLRPSALQTAAEPSRATPANSTQTQWHCPARLDPQSVAQLAASLASTNVLRALNWSQLEHITPQAAQALASLLAQWADQVCTLHFENVAVLERLLRAATPVAQAQTERYWWQLRLDLLRILRMQDEFDLVALDYCVTYEVSPPSWREARCQRIDQLPANAGAQTPLQRGGLDTTADEWRRSSGFARSVLLEPEAAGPLAVQLRGELQGDAVQAVLPQEKAILSTNKLVIDCTNLIRVDFSAAGSILNWVAQCESLGCHVEFRHVPHLVAAFFTLIGINEHAKILTRVD